MSSHPESLESICAFLSGTTSVSEFEERLYRDPGMESLLAQEKAPRYAHTGVTLYDYLIALDYEHPRDIRTAQGALIGLLEKRGIAVTPSRAVENECNLLRSAQPRWLDADLKYLSDLLAAAPALPLAERKAWLKNRILELFKYVKRPPRWIQSPSWPMGKDGPMVFLGQLAVDDYFHDTSAVYVFHDPATGQCQSIVQSY